MILLYVKSLVLNTYMHFLTNPHSFAQTFYHYSDLTDEMR